MQCYIEINNTKLRQRYSVSPTDQQIYLHVQSNHPKSLKDSIPYSQPLHIKTDCESSTNCEFSKNTVTSLQKDSKKKLTPRIW